VRVGLLTCGLIALVIALGSLLPMAPSAPGASLARAAAVYEVTDHSGKASAPCTKRALEAAMRRAHSHARVATKHSFGCARGFAYAFAIVGSGAVSYEENLLFRASGRRWRVVSRAKYCNKPAVPARIKKAVCYSS
jgi:hypothetical protein